MRVQLIAQILQFRFRTVPFRFLTGSFRLCPSGTHTYGGTQSDGEDETQHISDKEQPSRRNSRPVRFGNKGRIECQTPPKVQHQTDDTQQEDVVSNIPLGLALEKVSGNQQEVVDVERDHERQRYGRMAYVCHPVDVSVFTLYKEERKTEHNPPADNVYQCFQGTTCGC